MVLVYISCFIFRSLRFFCYFVCELRSVESIRISICIKVTFCTPALGIVSLLHSSFGALQEVMYVCMCVEFKESWCCCCRRAMEIVSRVYKQFYFAGFSNLLMDSYHNFFTLEFDTVFFLIQTFEG